MLKSFFLFFIFFTLCLSASDKVEIYATTIDSKDPIITADGGITVVYKNYFLSAQKAVYNKDTGDLELYENIKVTNDNNYRIIGDYARLNLAKKEKIFKPFYLLEKSSNVWISGDDASSKDIEIDIKSGVVSGCDQNDPLWKMQFTSSDYNSETKWLNLYNTTLYLYDLPIMYTPYFGYSLDNKRKTGLLMPALGLSDKEGFYYEQPIYIAEYDWWDLEIKPQVRTNRGSGIYSDFRFVDSAISKGSLKLGYFNEQDEYFYENNLKNDSHYGFNFNYDNRDVINQWFNTDFEGQSGLYVDIKNMNDVDYINLETNDNMNTNTATQLLSRVNLFYNTDENYFATYFKYYQDLTISDNDETLQKLPTFHYHKYLSTFFEDHLFYDVDLKSTNITRVTNNTAVQTDLNIPITMQTSLFDEFLHISYQGNIYAQHSTFGGIEDDAVSGVEYNDGYFARYYSSISAATQLTRAFEEITHVISFSSKYTHGGNDIRDGFYSDHQDTCAKPENKYNTECEFYNITDIDEALQFDMSQFFYNTSGEEMVYHRLAQRISYVQGQSKYGELENELNVKIVDGLFLYNNMFYNFDKNSFSKIFNKISLNAYGVGLNLSHLYKNSFLEPSQTYTPYTSYITSGANYTYDDHYSYHVRYDYDIETKIEKSAEVGFLYKKRCWDFGIRYVENNRPVLTQSGESSIYDKYLYFTIVLKPIMQSGGGSSDFALRLPDS